ncbi:cell division protein [Erythrobacter longus]|uniref:Cell division protein n=1 Tax=Erythrobacter longus TaxID=1044 RepID=A0A074MUC3_ERYLO|nr:FtsX-like permease family protein [Erythrobacter longus]KEO89207.1 cell division protein [Erythrobacter longus]
MSETPFPETGPQDDDLAPAKNISAGLAPPARLSGPIPWVIAILIALVVIAAAGGLSLRNLAQNARADLADAVTVQIIEADEEARTVQAQAAAKALGAHPLVTTVRVVPEDELQELLEPWLGRGAASENVPIPALIDVELIRRASGDELAQLQSALDAALEPMGGTARVDAQSQWLRPVYDALSALQYLALALIILVSLATAAAVWLASRNAFINHRETVEIVHLLGGTDKQVTRMFERSVIQEAAFGALIGLLLGLGAVWLLGQQFASLDSGMVGGGGLRMLDWAIIAAIPVGGVCLALITGRITIGYALRSML